MAIADLCDTIKITATSIQDIIKIVLDIFAKYFKLKYNQ